MEGMETQSVNVYSHVNFRVLKAAHTPLLHLEATSAKLQFSKDLSSAPSS